LYSRQADADEVRENLQTPVDVKAQGERVKKLAALLEGGAGKRTNTDVVRCHLTRILLLTLVVV
jgi:hypothetical protein